MTWTVTDLFCGAGGSSLGAETVPGVRLRMAANHWKTAIRTHSANFPHADHDCADISQVDPRRFERTNILLASPECTNHSMAKSHKTDLFDPNGDPAAERSRATMWDVCRFAERHHYDCVVVENVTEVRRWAPFEAWLSAMSLLGYDYELLYINSMMVLPTPQSRDRFYGVFWKRGIPRPNLDFRPVGFCHNHGDVAAKQAWKKPGSPGGRYRQQYVYRCPKCLAVVAPYAMPAAAAIDWSIAGQRIGDRAKPLSPNTMRRIRLGLERYGPAVVQRYGNTFERPGSDYARAWSATDAPIPTMMTDLQHGLVTPLHHGAGGPGARSTDEVWPTQTGRAENALVGFDPFIAELRGGASDTRPCSEPLATVCASGNHHGVVTPPGFMVKNYGDGRDPSMSFGFERPFGAVTTQDHHSVVRFDSTVDPDAFVSSYYGNGNCSPVRQPLPTVRTHDSAALINPGIDVEDCSFRMLEPHEVKAAMAFAPDYHLVGNKRDQVRQLGNGVTPPVMGMIVGRLVDAMEGAIAA